MTLDNQLKGMIRRSTDETWKGHEAALIKLYNMMTLDTFIRGLGEPLSLFCKNYKPKSLASAYHYCVEFLNLNARSVPFKSELLAPVPAPRGNIPVPPPKPVPTHRHPQQIPQPLPRQQFPVQNQFQLYPRAPFQNTPNVFASNRTFYQQQPRPEPMDVDHSIRSRMLNYGNRPNFKTTRPATESIQAINPSAKRVAHQLEDVPNEEYEQFNEETFDSYSDVSEMNFLKPLNPK